MDEDGGQGTPVNSRPGKPPIGQQIATFRYDETVELPVDCEEPSLGRRVSVGTLRPPSLASAPQAHGDNVWRRGKSQQWGDRLNVCICFKSPLIKGNLQVVRST